jgi:hypothetical protein
MDVAWTMREVEPTLSHWEKQFRLNDSNRLEPMPLGLSLVLCILNARCTRELITLSCGVAKRKRPMKKVSRDDDVMREVNFGPT